jgi:hypothetical protein
VVSRPLGQGAIARVMSRSPQCGTTNGERAQAHMLPTEGLVRWFLPLWSNSECTSDSSLKQRWIKT